MRSFEKHEILEAIEYAKAGGQALHVWTPPKRGWPGAPLVFRRAAERGEKWAHLLDRDEARLVDTVRYLGVNVVRIGRKGTMMHVDLCGKPLAMACLRCAEDAKDGRL